MNLGVFRASGHAGSYLRLRAHHGSFLDQPNPNADTVNSYYDLGFDQLPSVDSIKQALRKNGVLCVCLTEDVPVHLEYSWALAGRLALIDEVKAVAIWITGRGPGYPRNYRIIITKDPENFPLGMKIE